MIRTAVGQDQGAIADVCKGALIADGEEASLLPELLWCSPGGESRLRVVAEEEGEVVGVALAALRAQGGSPPVGHIDLLAVAPKAQRRGHGRHLVAACEDRIKDIGVAQACLGGNAPCYAWPGIDVSYTAAVRLAESTGYEPWEEAVNMVVDLTTAPIATAAAERGLAERGIAIRRLEMSDEPYFSSWVEQHWSREWAWEATRPLVRQEAACYVATRGGNLLAFAAYGCNRPSWFGPMGTVPAEQRQGLGAVLLRRCLADQRSAGMTRSTIGWVGPVEFYRRTVGARTDRLFRLYRKAL